MSAGNHLLIAEAHKPQAVAGICQLLIGDTHTRQVELPDSADLGVRTSRSMRLNDKRL